MRSLRPRNRTPQQDTLLVTESMTAMPIRPIPWTESSELPLNRGARRTRALQIQLAAAYIDEEDVPLQRGEC